MYEWLRREHGAGVKTSTADVHPSVASSAPVTSSLSRSWCVSAIRIIPVFAAAVVPFQIVPSAAFEDSKQLPAETRQILSNESESVPWLGPSERRTRSKSITSTSIKLPGWRCAWLSSD